MAAEKLHAAPNDAAASPKTEANTARENPVAAAAAAPVKKQTRNAMQAGSSRKSRSRSNSRERRTSTPADSNAAI